MEARVHHLEQRVDYVAQIVQYLVVIVPQGHRIVMGTVVRIQQRVDDLTEGIHIIGDAVAFLLDENTRFRNRQNAQAQDILRIEGKVDNIGDKVDELTRTVNILVVACFLFFMASTGIFNNTTWFHDDVVNHCDLPLPSTITPLPSNVAGELTFDPDYQRLLLPDYSETTTLSLPDTEMTTDTTTLLLPDMKTTPDMKKETSDTKKKKKSKWLESAEQLVE